MQKTSTHLKKTDFAKKQLDLKDAEMQPSENVLKNILQFAASYKAQQIDKGQYIDMILN